MDSFLKMTGDGVYRPCSMGNSPEQDSKTSNLFLKIRDFFNCWPDRTIKKKKTNKKNITKFIGITLLSSLFIVSTVACGIMWFTDLYVEEIINQMTIRKGSDVFEAWRKPPLKPLICVFVFNYTNVPEFVAGIDKKIKLEEVGPYCYRETLEKKDVIFNDDNTVTYGDTRKHVFEPESSNGTQDDQLIVPNLALISTIAMGDNLNKIMKMSLNMFLKNILRYSNTMIKVRAHDFLFGYDDRLVKLGTRIAKLFDIHLPFEKFGLLAQRAASTDDTITVHTGTNDVDHIGIVTKVNGQEALDAWEDEECNRIDGSDGAFFPRHTLNESATVYLFHKDMCRKMPFIYDKEVDFGEGVKGMRFHAASNVYNTNGTCFCPITGCAPNGVFDISPCSMGAPLLMSFPHFLNGDPSLSEPFEGLHPDPVKHEFYIDIQRLLGFTLGTVSRLQLNVQIRKTKGTSMLTEFPDRLIMPVVWLQVSAEKMPPDLFHLIYHATITVRRMQVALQWGLLFITLALALGIVYQFRKTNQALGINPKEAEALAGKEMTTITIDNA